MQPTSFLTVPLRAPSGAGSQLTLQRSDFAFLNLSSSPSITSPSFYTKSYLWTCIRSGFLLQKEGMLFLQILNFLLTIMPLSQLTPEGTEPFSSLRQTA